MKRLQTMELGPFPRSAVVALAVALPCAVALAAVGRIDTPGMALAGLLVGALGVYSMLTLSAWLGMYLAETAIDAVGTAAAQDAGPADTVSPSDQEELATTGGSAEERR